MIYNDPVKLESHPESEVATMKKNFSILLFFTSEKKLQKILISWTRRELNPRPLRCERNDLPLIYEPKNETISENNLDI